MSTIEERRAIASDGVQDYRLNGAVGTRVFLQPLAALVENLGMFAVLGTLCVGSALLAGALIYGTEGLATAAGWVLVASAIVAWYGATGVMLAYAGGRTILPLGKYSREANTPGARPTKPIELEWAEPGVKMGQ